MPIDAQSLSLIARTSAPLGGPESRILREGTISIIKHDLDSRLNMIRDTVDELEYYISRGRPFRKYRIKGHAGVGDVRDQSGGTTRSRAGPSDNFQSAACDIQVDILARVVAMLRPYASSQNGMRIEFEMHQIPSLNVDRDLIELRDLQPNSECREIWRSREHHFSEGAKIEMSGFDLCHQPRHWHREQRGASDRTPESIARRRLARWPWGSAWEHSSRKRSWNVTEARCSSQTRRTPRFLPSSRGLGTLNEKELTHGQDSVDDEPYYAQNYVRRLEDAGYKVTLCDYAEGGLQRLLESPGGFEVLILEIHYAHAARRFPRGNR